MTTRARRSTVTMFSGTLPISLVDAKTFVNDTTDANDALISSLVSAGFTRAEQNLDRAILTQTRRWRFEREPESPIYLEPFDESGFVIQRAVNGAYVDLDSDNYSVGGSEGQVYAAGDYWHEFLGRRCFEFTSGNLVGGVWAYQIEATCGWAPDELPGDLRFAILTYVKDLYDHRGIRDIGRPKTKPWEQVQHYSWSRG